MYLISNINKRFLFDVHLIQVIENAEFHSSDESSDEEEAVKAGQVIS